MQNSECSSHSQRAKYLKGNCGRIGRCICLFISFIWRLSDSIAFSLFLFRSTNKCNVYGVSGAAIIVHREAAVVTKAAGGGIEDHVLYRSHNTAMERAQLEHVARQFTSTKEVDLREFDLRDIGSVGDGMDFGDTESFESAQSTSSAGGTLRRDGKDLEAGRRRAFKLPQIAFARSFPFVVVDESGTQKRGAERSGSSSSSEERLVGSVVLIDHRRHAIEESDPTNPFVDAVASQRGSGLATSFLSCSFVARTRDAADVVRLFNTCNFDSK